MIGGIEMRRPANWRCVILILVLIGSSSNIALAQETTATISGTAKDASGAVVPGVTVSVKNVATSVSRSAVTDSEGRYTVPELAPGSYIRSKQQ